MVLLIFIIEIQIAETKNKLLDVKWKGKRESVYHNTYTEMVKDFSTIPNQKLCDKMGITVIFTLYIQITTSEHTITNSHSIKRFFIVTKVMKKLKKWQELGKKHQFQTFRFEISNEDNEEEVFKGLFKEIIKNKDPFIPKTKANKKRR